MTFQFDGIGGNLIRLEGESREKRGREERRR